MQLKITEPHTGVWLIPTCWFHNVAWPLTTDTKTSLNIKNSSQTNLDIAFKFKIQQSIVSFILNGGWNRFCKCTNFQLLRSGDLDLDLRPGKVKVIRSRSCIRSYITYALLHTCQISTELEELVLNGQTNGCAYLCMHVWTKIKTNFIRSTQSEST